MIRTRLANYFVLGLLLLPAAFMVGCKKPLPPPAPAPKATPTPSPDKDAIVFIKNGQVWMMKWDGSSAGPLLSRKNASFWLPSASPLGDDLLAWISQPDGSQDIVRIRLDGRYEILSALGERALAAMKNVRLGNSPVYDSRAERIAYAYNGMIWIMNRDGYNAHTVIADGLSYSPAWSPDDKKIAYVNGKDGHYNLWVTDVDSRDTWQVTDFQDYTVGHPRWISDGKRIMLTRSQKDESDIVTVLADTDVPLVDADMVTKNRLSASANINKDGKYLAMSSARPASGQGPAENWEIWSSDAAGKEAKKLSTDGGISPVWIRPSVATSVAAAPATTTAAVAVAAKPQPTAVATTVPTVVPTAVLTLAPKALTQTAAAAAPTALPSPPATVAAPVRTAAAPTPKPRVDPAASAPPLSGKPAPTQPPAKAPPLRVRLRVSFDPENDQLLLSSLTELKKTAGRVKQYAGASIEVYGPLDRAALRGRYASDEDRSRARAEQVATQLAREAGVAPSSIKAMPYAPVVIGAPAPNGIEVHVELK